MFIVMDWKHVSEEMYGIDWKCKYLKIMQTVCIGKFLDIFQLDINLLSYDKIAR